MNLIKCHTPKYNTTSVFCGRIRKSMMTVPGQPLGMTGSDACASISEWWFCVVCAANCLHNHIVQCVCGVWCVHVYVVDVFKSQHWSHCFDSSYVTDRHIIVLSVCTISCEIRMYNSQGIIQKEVPPPKHTHHRLVPSVASAEIENTMHIKWWMSHRLHYSTYILCLILTVTRQV